MGAGLQSGTSTQAALLGEGLCPPQPPLYYSLLLLSPIKPKNGIKIQISYLIRYS